MSAKPISIAIVDANPLFRKILVNYVIERENINVLIQTSDLLDLSIKLRNFNIDVLLIDIYLNDQNVERALEIIQNEHPDVRILVLSMCSDIAMISGLLDLGIHGYVSKMDEPEEVLQAIMAVAEKKIYRNKLFTDALYWNKQNNTKIYTEADFISLTDRERRILQLLWEEKSNKEIADELFLSIRSIEKIRQDMKEKLGLKSTVGLLKYAIRKKIISIGINNFSAAIHGR